MAIGIAGDNPVSTPSAQAAALAPAQSQDLLTQILIELRTLTTVTNNGLNGTDELSNIRQDQDIAVVTGVGY